MKIYLKKKNENSLWHYWFLIIVILTTAVITITFTSSFLKKGEINFIPYLILLLILSITFMVITVFAKNIKPKTDDLIKILELFLIVMTILIASTQVHILDKQTELSNKQIDIIKRTTQFNKPNIILTKTRDSRFYRYRLENLDEPNSELEKVPIGIINEGKTVAPIVSVHLKSGLFLWRGWDFGGSYYKWDIDGIESLGYNFTSLWIKSNANGNLSAGEYNLTMIIECPYCENPNKEENVTICIYSENENIEKECGGKWNF